VASVSVITDRDTGRPRGFAFIEMHDSGAAQNAIRGVNGTQLGGRTNVNKPNLRLTVVAAAGHPAAAGAIKRAVRP
jgi:RNA recognition motif-containing protein